MTAGQNRLSRGTSQTGRNSRSSSGCCRNRRSGTPHLNSRTDSSGSFRNPRRSRNRCSNPLCASTPQGRQGSCTPFPTPTIDTPRCHCTVHRIRRWPWGPGGTRSMDPIRRQRTYRPQSRCTPGRTRSCLRDRCPPGGWHRCPMSPSRCRPDTNRCMDCCSSTRPHRYHWHTSSLPSRLLRWSS